MARYTRPEQLSVQSATETNQEDNVTINQTDEEYNTDIENDIENDFEYEDPENTEEYEDSEVAEDSEDADEDADEDSDEDSDEDADEDADAKAEAEEAARLEAERLADEFINAVNPIVDSAEITDSGEIDSASVAKVVALYQGVPGVRAKGMARAKVEEMMHRYVMDGDLKFAKVYMLLIPELKSAQPAKAAKPVRKLSPEEQFLYWAKRVAELDLARQLLVVPEEVRAIDSNGRIAELAEGMYNDYYASVQEYIAYLNGEGEIDPETEKPVEPEAPEFVKSAAQLALGLGVSRKKKNRSATRASGPRRRPRKHIEQVFADLEVGTFLKINEIAMAKSKEYGDTAPSQGAIASNLNNENFNTPWIETTEENGYLGARKIAEAN